MRKYVNNGIVNLGTAYDYDDAVAEIAMTLAVGTRSDGRYHIADIFSAGSINRWSKCKPFRHNSDNFGYDYNNPSVGNAERKRQAQIANYGISIPTSGYGNAKDMAKAVYNNTAVWEYMKPRGREMNEPFRLRDFDGYNHNARTPIFCEQGDYTLSTQTTTKDIAPLFRVVQPSDTQIALSDLRFDNAANNYTFNEMYVGLCCYNPSTETAYTTIQNKSFGQYLEETANNEIGFIVNVAAPSSVGSTINYFCFPFFCTQPNGTTFYPVPFAKQTISVKREAQGYIRTGVDAFLLNGTTSPLYYRGYVYNGTSSAKTATYRIIGLRSGDKYDQVVVLASGTVTVPAMSTAYMPSSVGGKYTDTLYINQIQYVYCELKQGELYIGDEISVSPVIRNADPNDPPYTPYA